MGKRSDGTFERRARDAYPTPPSAVLPLLPHLAPETRFIEPCAGDGALVDNLTAYGHRCFHAGDIEPRRSDIRYGDATGRWCLDLACFDCFVTNPPWSRPLLHELICNFASVAPTWLLFDADWVHTRQATPYLPLLRKIVAVGRVKWIPDSKFVGKDNACWHLFAASESGPIEFVGRTP